MKKIRFLSMFSGIEAASMAWIPLGWECVAVAEIEPFPCAVLKHHYPDVPNLGDVTKVTEQQIKDLGHIDLAVLGFPCQDLSVAGKRKGLTNADGSPTRSGLFFAAMQIVQWANPRWTVGENVPGMFSSNEGRDFAAVVGELAGAEFDVPRDGWRNSGVALGPSGLVEWSVLDAQWFGVAQRRQRVFFVRDSGDWASRSPVLLERESLRRDNPPSREARQRPAPTLSARTKGGGGLGTDFDLDGGLICAGTGQAGTEFLRNLSPTLNCNHEQPYIAHSLRGEGFDASEDGTGRGTPLVPVLHRNSGQGYWTEDGVAGSLSTEARGIHENNLVTPVAYRTTGNCGVQVQGDKVACLNTGTDPSANIVRRGMAVRRLTPRECERLQGFPDDNTLIPHRGKPAKDGPRYKSLGNSMCTNVMHWIGRRIQQVDSL